MARWAVVGVVVGLNLGMALGCGMGEVEPAFERAEVDTLQGEVPEPFASMEDLPFYGGLVQKSANGFMEISYAPDAHHVDGEMLVEWWPASGKAAGWRPTVELKSAGGSPVPATA